VRLFTKKEGVIIGRAQGRALSGAALFSKKEILTSDEMALHVHVVGASGYGKTVLLKKIIQYKIQKGEGLLFVDLKADSELLTDIKKIAEKANRLEDLKFFSISDPECSSFYNPIKNGTYSQIRDRVMGSLNWSEEYYKNQAGSFLLKLLMGLKKLQKIDMGFEYGLMELLRASTDVQYIEELFFKLKGNKEAHKEESILRELIEWMSEKENFRSLSGLRSQLESLMLSEFGEKLKTGDDEIDLFEAVKHKKIIIVFLDSRRYQELAMQMGRLLLQDLKAVSSKIDSEIPKNERSAFSVIIDEFSDLASEDFISFLDRARSSKMSVVLAHQEISDLSRVSPEFAGRLLGNMSTNYVFLQKRPESAELFSGMAGTRSVYKETDQMDSLLGFSIPSGKKSRREVEEFLIHPNKIKSLPVGRCVVIKKYPKATSSIVDVFPEGKT